MVLFQIYIFLFGKLFTEGNFFLEAWRIQAAFIALPGFGIRESGHIHCLGSCKEYEMDHQDYILHFCSRTCDRNYQSLINGRLMAG